MNLKIGYFCLNCGAELSNREIKHGKDGLYHFDEKGIICEPVEAMIDDEGKEDKIAY